MIHAPRHHPFRASRRGFTMLEVSLAAVIGGLIVLASLGVFSALDRADLTLKSRFDHSMQMSRLQTVMRRTFVNLAMSTKQPPRSRPSAGRTSAQQSAPTPTAAAEAQNPPGGLTEEPQIPEPARVILGFEDRLGPIEMQRLEKFGTGPNVPASWRPQRLEVVLSRPPVPIPKGAAAGVFPEAGTGLDEFSDKTAVSASRLFRGIYELQPTPAGSRGPNGERPRPFTTWSLWWRPMPPAMPEEAGSEGEVREFELAPPSLIASDLTYLRWQFFDDRTLKHEFSTAYYLGLPAYVQLEVQTASGIWASWMFEVDFQLASESSSDQQQQGGGSIGGGGRSINRTPGRTDPASRRGNQARPAGGEQ
jgi:prepilin-type N-terminal cleavage/methylation domain-containing protein